MTKMFPVIDLVATGENITRLRKKIGEYGKRIVTRLGYGYCFECE